VNLKWDSHGGKCKSCVVRMLWKTPINTIMPRCPVLYVLLRCWNNTVLKARYRYIGSIKSGQFILVRSWQDLLILLKDSIAFYRKERIICVDDVLILSTQ
jgi:hypothetical protein